MNNDILPPSQPKPSQTPAPRSEAEPPLTQSTPLLLEEHGSPEATKKWSPRKKLGILLAILVLLIGTVIISGVIWYQQALRPVSSNSHASRVNLVIAPGTTPSEIGKLLADKAVIRSTTAFGIYTRLNGTQNLLQAGSYSLSPHDSTQTIVEHIVSGKTDEFNITFLPGATLAENKKVLQKAGYSDTEIEAAFKKTYDSPLFKDKPASADLEGYIFGQTYKITAGMPVEEILQRTFDEFYAALEKDNLISGFKSHDLTLYQAITLASIIQREVSNPADEKQVAQVFYKRLKAGTVLGSDVTYKYAAKRFNLVDSPNQDSPYNTRRFKGLPPGPIAVPGLGALQAVAHPAAGSYEFFLAGDDGNTYFAHTNEQHEQNIKDHCQINCAE